MIGSFVFRTLALVLGYAYPAYECFKVVELNRPDLEQLHFWCKYWILIAVLTVLERVGDTFISWLPMYSEAKVAFLVYLWYPKTRGAIYVYETFFSPYVASHETEIDRILLELKTRAGDFVVLYWKNAASYVRTRVFEILQYVASQAPSQESRPQITRQREHQTPALVTPGSKTATAPSSPRPSHAPAAPATKANQEPTKDQGLPAVPTPNQAESSSHSGTELSLSETASPPSVSGEVDQVGVGATATTSTGKHSPSPRESRVEEGVRITRASLRKRAAGFGPPPH